MKFTPFQLAILAVAGFGSVVLLNVLAQYKSNEEFRGYLSGLANDPASFIPKRNQRVAEENMEPVLAIAQNNENEDNDDDE
jgi:hypothetical protein